VHQYLAEVLSMTGCGCELLFPDQPSFSFQDTARLKVSESSLANPSPAVGKNQGFQINADFDVSEPLLAISCWRLVHSLCQVVMVFVVYDYDL